MEIIKNPKKRSYNLDTQIQFLIKKMKRKFKQKEIGILIFIENENPNLSPGKLFVKMK